MKGTAKELLLSLSATAAATENRTTHPLTAETKWTNQSLIENFATSYLLALSQHEEQQKLEFSK